MTDVLGQLDRLYAAAENFMLNVGVAREEVTVENVHALLELASELSDNVCFPFWVENEPCYLSKERCKNCDYKPSVGDVE